MLECRWVKNQRATGGTDGSRQASFRVPPTLKIMAEIISLFEHPDFDYPYGVCDECNCDDWRMLMSPEGEDAGIIGFQCANIDCGVVAIFDESRQIILELE